MLASVVAAVDFRSFVSGVNNILVPGVKNYRPYGQAVIRNIELFPVLTVVSAAVRPVLGSSKNDLRTQRMYSYGPYSRGFR